MTPAPCAPRPPNGRDSEHWLLVDGQPVLARWRNRHWWHPTFVRAMSPWAAVAAGWSYLGPWQAGADHREVRAALAVVLKAELAVADIPCCIFESVGATMGDADPATPLRRPPPTTDSARARSA